MTTPSRTIEKVLGDNHYALKLGEDHEQVFTHDEIITALNKRFEDGHQYWVFNNIIGRRNLVEKETGSAEL